MPAERHCDVTAYPDGPYVVRGAFRLVDSSGAAIEVRRRTVAVCRCGRSRLAPFCDGTHKAAGFTAPFVAHATPPAGVEPQGMMPRAA